MDGQKGLKELLDTPEKEKRKQNFLAFWDFCCDWLGEVQEFPTPGKEIVFQPIKGFLTRT
jgi:hypothetical protein